MSQAFVKEPDGDQVADDQPELPHSPHTNYVTPAGLAALRAALAGWETRRRDFAAQDNALANKLHIAQAEREMRYFNERIRRAVVVDPATQPAGEVAFGAAVTVEDEDGEHRAFIIVGEDEADPRAGKVSWVSPLAAALLEARVGDLVTWKRPAGEVELEILTIDYAVHD
jgi:transcription elongation GreA/GreB family factor